MRCVDYTQSEDTLVLVIEEETLLYSCFYIITTKVRLLAPLWMCLSIQRRKRAQATISNMFYTAVIYLSHQEDWQTQMFVHTAVVMLSYGSLLWLRHHPGRQQKSTELPFSWSIMGEIDSDRCTVGKFSTRKMIDTIQHHSHCYVMWGPDQKASSNVDYRLVICANAYLRFQCLPINKTIPKAWTLTF